jgi:hypothetical protein
VGDTDRRALRSWAARLTRLVDRGADPVTVVAHVAAHVADAVGAGRAAAGLPLLARAGRPDPALLAATAPPAPPRPELLPAAYATVLAPAVRRRRGHVHTPEPVARRVAAVTLAGVDPQRTTVVDPAVGGGALLLAAARELAAAGAPLPAVVRRLRGTDVDPLAVAVAETALGLLAAEGGQVTEAHLAVADALDGDHPLLATASADAAVGNPPFLSQLARATARDPATTARLRARYGDAARAYADAANLFLLRALAAVRPGGRVGMILPEAFLAARDARPARRAAIETARLVWLWRSVEPAFDGADSRVVALVFERTTETPARSHAVRRADGPSFRSLAPLRVSRDALAAAPTWSPLVADRRIPAVAPRADGLLGLYCRATAGFRDEYYGLVPLVVEGDDGHEKPRLVTCGLLDPARCWWGERPARFAGRAWRRPVVDLARLTPASRLEAWARRLLVPKLVLATQTKVLEVAADPAGRMLPATPVISVLVAPGRLWHVAAALGSPVLSTLVARHHAGSALAPDAIRIPARAVSGLPAPADAAAWDEGAALFRSAAEAPDERTRLEILVRCGAIMCAAYGIDSARAPALLDWWAARLPRGQAPAGPPKRGGRFSRWAASPSAASGPPNPRNS